MEEQKKGKFYDIDPETCSMKELEEAILTCQNIEDEYNTKQLGAKTFINSIYGALANKFYYNSNIAMAESITLQGQDLIKYSVRVVDQYFAEIWPDDTETHKKIAEYMLRKYTDFDVKNFMKFASQPVQFGDSIQIYGDTDSVSKDSIIRTKKHPDGITVEDFYNENIKNQGETTLSGHESVHTKDLILNYTDELLFQKVARIIRHKVLKSEWRVTTESGKYIECTNDHSLIVYRDDKQVTVKPHEVESTDFILVVNPVENKSNGIFKRFQKAKQKFETKFERVSACGITGTFGLNDDYVYDIEVDDDSHTFIANDMLVHNSAYITLQPIIDACHIPLEQETDFVLAINDCILAEYLENAFDKYAEDFNCPKNVEKFELEKISRAIIMLAKKKYIMDISWKEPDVHVAPLHSLVYKGIEANQSATPEVCREYQKEFIKFMLGKIDTGEKPSYPEIVRKLKDIKTRFSMQSPNEVSKSFAMSDYEKYINNDKTPEIKFMDNVVCPMHVRAAAIYNNMLYNKAKKYKSKYNFIRKGDKVKFYYTMDDGVFAFLPNEYPGEFAPPMNIDIQFEKMVLEPLNRIVEACGYPKVSSSLTFSVSLF